MTSEINESSHLEVPNRGESKTESSSRETPIILAGPKLTVTPRTKQAPRGKIFEDEARGTVFWEIAESSEEEGDIEGGQPKANGKWGHPFKIEWINSFLLYIQT